MPWLDNWVERNAKAEDAKYWRDEYQKLLREFADNNNQLMDQVVSLKRDLKYLRKRTSQLEAENWQLRNNRRKGL